MKREIVFFDVWKEICHILKKKKSLFNIIFILNKNRSNKKNGTIKISSPFKTIFHGLCCQLLTFIISLIIIFLICKYLGKNLFIIFFVMGIEMIIVIIIIILIIIMLCAIKDNNLKDNNLKDNLIKFEKKE